MTKPIAIHLAEQIEAEGRIDTAAELRRQHETIVKLTEAARESLIDAACFRFWVREAAYRPGEMAKLIANCVTEADYRAAIMPHVIQGECE